MMSMSITDLRRGYVAGELQPDAVIAEAVQRSDALRDRHVWITRLSDAQLAPYLAKLATRSPNDLPLYGIPFAIKDNIDLAGVPTTAACPAYSYVPERSATVVQRLIDAGAIPIGKTNLDQFATGLVGARSPYGVCENAIDRKFVSGGSSSGSAVAVAMDAVSFSLGTDTAGSGRVPAAFNNIIGLKPSCGLLSTRGVVPACRSLDAVSIFASTADDASAVLEVAAGFDPEDAYSRALKLNARRLAQFKVGVPRASQLEFFGDENYARLFTAACKQLSELGGTPVEIDFEPFLTTARLLYEGPWVAERYAAIADFIERQPDALHPTTRQIIGAGAQLSAVDAFRAQYRLKALQRATAQIWSDIDVLVTPTAGTIYTIAEVLREPIKLNSNLGLYTNFVNLLDLAAISVPAGRREDGMPFGLTLIAPAADDRVLLNLAARAHPLMAECLGATPRRVPQAVQTTQGSDDIAVVVCGAHMSGLPLNHQLTDRGARFVRATQTAPKYRFYALPGGPPKRPGLIRVTQKGAAIDVEVWSVPQQHFGSFVAGIPSPLGIGKVELADGSSCSGFVCEAYAVEGAEEITGLGSWRTYLARGAR